MSEHLFQALVFLGQLGDGFLQVVILFLQETGPQNDLVLFDSACLSGSLGGHVILCPTGPVFRVFQSIRHQSFPRFGHDGLRLQLVRVEVNVGWVKVSRAGSRIRDTGKKKSNIMRKCKWSLPEFDVVVVVLIGNRPGGRSWRRRVRKTCLLEELFQIHHRIRWRGRSRGMGWGSVVINHLAVIHGIRSAGLAVTCGKVVAGAEEATFARRKFHGCWRTDQFHDQNLFEPIPGSTLEYIAWASVYEEDQNCRSRCVSHSRLRHVFIHVRLNSYLQKMLHSMMMRYEIFWWDSWRGRTLLLTFWSACSLALD